MTKLLAEPGAGEQLGRYELVAEIASGGMATVYLARAIGMVDFRRFFAIKRLHPQLANDPDFVAMFIDEAKLAARIHHPNVVPIFEIGMKDEQYFLVMDYVEGDTASRLIVRSKHAGKVLPIGFTVRVLVETLAGLHAAHELTSDEGAPLEIIHRDVSPQNILVGVDGVARITDFGVARAAARIGERTQTGHLKGKLAYMAPEQIRGGSMGIDRRVDIFAAGIVLWEMLAGERLFKAATDGETLFKVAAADVPELATRVPGLPPPIAEVCLRALAKDPADRWATAADFGDALEAAARQAGTMFTARESATLVNELVGQEITAHRDLVRTWLTRSDVSRSGVALAQPFSPPRQSQQVLDPVSDATPESGSHTAPTPLPEPLPEARNLGNLTSDHEDLATRIDLEIEVLPTVDANGLPMTPPAPPPLAPTPMPNIPQPATVPEFYPAAVLAAMQAGSNPVPPGAFVPAPAPPPPFGPMAPVAPAPPEPQARLPTWTLAVPVLLLVAVVAAVIVLKARGEPTSTPVPPKTTSNTTATATATDTPTAAATTPVATATQTATATDTATSPPTTTATVTAVPTATAPRPTSTVVATAVKPIPVPTTSKPKPLDNSSFGGRK